MNLMTHIAPTPQEKADRTERYLHHIVVDAPAFIEDAIRFEGGSIESWAGFIRHGVVHFASHDGETFYLVPRAPRLTTDYHILGRPSCMGTLLVWDRISLERLAGRCSDRVRLQPWPLGKEESR